MTNEKVTPWIDGSVRPARDGVYEREDGIGGIHYARYIYGYWRQSHPSFEKASQEHRTTSFQYRAWRGLAQNPEVKP